MLGHSYAWYGLYWVGLVNPLSEQEGIASSLHPGHSRHPGFACFPLLDSGQKGPDVENPPSASFLCFSLLDRPLL